MANFNIIQSGTPGKGWHKSTKPDVKKIREATKSNITVPASIPTPYAYIDVAYQAFIDINASGSNLTDELSPSNLVISHVLDVAELFFFIDRYPELEVLPWNSAKLSSIHDGNLRDSLVKYWEAPLAQKTYGFSEKPLFILLLDGHPIGATSPCTLFFPSADAQVHIQTFNEKHMTDYFHPKEPKMIYERDTQFLQYLFMYHFSEREQLVAASSHFADFLANVWNTPNVLAPELKEKLEVAKSQTISDYLHHTHNMSVNQLNIMKAPNPKISDSDFSIVGSIIEENPPLVLPSGSEVDSYVGWAYVDQNELFTNRLSIDAKNEQFGTEDSTIPGKGIKHDWFSTDNLLSDTIVVFKPKSNGECAVVNERFHSFGLDTCLPPLKQDFFKLYKVSDLTDTSVNGKPSLSISQNVSGAIRVELKIPVRNNMHVTLSKRYDVGSIFLMDDDESIDLAIMPFTNCNDHSPIKEIDYTIGYLEGSTETHAPKALLSVVDNNEVHPLTDGTLREGSNSEDIELTVYHRYKGNMQALCMTIHNSALPLDVQSKSSEDLECVIIPRLETYVPVAHKSYFAIDFGTTSTYMYSQINGDGAQFHYKEENNLLVCMLDRSKSAAVNRKQVKFEYCMIPLELGVKSARQSKSNVTFPVRSAMLANNSWKEHNVPSVFKDVNFHLQYPNVIEHSTLTLKTNVKWTENGKLRDAYIEQLLYMVYLKAVSEKLDFSQLKVVWTYPIAINDKDLRKAWYNARDKYSFEENSIVDLTESIAPYYTLTEMFGQHAVVACIDIGGGTSDFAIFKSDGIVSMEPKVASVRFASDHLYSDGFGNNFVENGFYRNYVKRIAPKLSEERKKDVLHLLKREQASIELNNFLFSVLPDYSDDLMQGNRFFSSYYVFFGSLVYYLAKTMCLQGVDKPSILYFTGNGARSLQILDQDPSGKYEAASELVNYIFAEVYGLESCSIQVKLDNDPKGVTSKGALCFATKGDDSIKPTKYHWYGSNNDDKSKNFRTREYSMTWGDVNQSYMLDLWNQYDEMKSILMNYAKLISNEQTEFPITFEQANMLIKLIQGLINKDDVIQVFKDNKDADERAIDASVFFYPLIKIMPELAKASINDKTNN